MTIPATLPVAGQNRDRALAEAPIRTGPRAGPTKGEIVTDEWDEQLSEDEQNLAASLAELTSARYGAVVTEAARIRRRQDEFGDGPEEPDPRADAGPGTRPAG